jgi:hypothetical protein
MGLTFTKLFQRLWHKREMRAVQWRQQYYILRGPHAREHVGGR